MRSLLNLLSIVSIISVFIPAVAYGWGACTVEITGPSTVCIGETITVTACGTPSGGSCSWSSLPGLSASGCTATITGQTAGAFWLNVTYSKGYDFKCRDVDMITVTGRDADGDGHYPIGSCKQPADDCNDSDPSVYPGATETCDNKDNNCNGEVDEGLSTDADGDGHNTLDSCELPKDDCNDGDPTVYPGNSEICDNKDNNCNGQIDEGVNVDADQDGHYTPASCMTPNDDCNDSDPTVYPGSEEICDHRDNNCNGAVDEGCCRDVDGDGHDGFDAVNCSLGSDCNDSDASIYPGAPEICDFKDNNCNGQYDEGLSADADGDGYYSVGSCNVPNNDCNDGNASVFPGAPELCDGIDNDCDGQIDNGCECISGQTRSCYSGPPGTEGIGICQGGAQTCVSGQWGPCGGEILPAAPECNGKDNNCDGTIDDQQSCQCSTNLSNYSSVNAASGNISHSQNLFSTRGAGLTASMTLYYNSINTYTGPVGKKWTHTYDISLVRIYDGSMILNEGNGKGRFYTKTDAGYTSQAGDYSVLTKNADDTYVIVEKVGLKRTFDQNGKSTSVTDRNGNAMTFTYTNGNLAAATDPAGRTITFTYDTSNRIIGITDPGAGGYALAYTKDMPTSVTSPDGGQWIYTYDSDAFMLSKKDPNNNVTRYTYDNSHREITATNPDGRVKTMTYAPGDKTSRMTESDGGVWTYKYDTKLGELLRKTDPVGNITSYVYDKNRNLLSKADPDGSTISHAYDANGNMTSTTDALGQTTSYTYNAFGQATSITGPQGNTSAYTYDTRGNLTSTTDAAGATTRYLYDLKGNVTNITNALGQTTAFTFDQSNNISSITDPSGAVMKFTYDVNGNITSQSDANGNSTTFVYNSLNQLIRVTDSKSNATTYTYDKNGNRASQTDANGNTSYFTYNSRGQLIQVKDALGNVTTYTYGGTGCSTCGGSGDKITNITDAKGNTTTYQYDQSGRLIKETDPLGNSITYSYDAKGNRTAKTDAEGKTIKFTYDAAGRLIEKTYPDGTKEYFAYDSKNSLIAWQTPQEDSSYTYDTANRPTAKTLQNLGKTLKYEYNAAGRKSAMVDAEGGRTVYAYDAAGRAEKITDPAGNRVSYSYDAAGRRTGVSYSNGTSTVYTYDQAGRLLSITTTAPTGVISSYQYTYDKVGNRLSVKENSGNTTQYSYDKIYRLTAYDETRPDANKGTFEYDPVGNRVKMILARKYVQGDSRSFTYTYNQGNQLLGIVEKGRHSPIETAFGYDKNGSLASQAVTQSRITKNTTYQNDYQSRMSGVVTPDGKSIVIENLMDGYNRLSKTTNAGTTRYFHDGMSVIAEYDAIGGRTARYTLGPNTDETIAKKDAAGTFFYHYDGLGSVAAISDSTGKVVAKYDYEPFGRFKASTGSMIKNAYTFTGREWDEETGLYFYRARYMDPKIGRFVSKDPIGFEGGDTNLYVYVGNNPVNFTDPEGLKVSICSRPLNGMDNQYGLFRHDYIVVNGADYGFYCNGCTVSGPGIVKGPGIENNSNCAEVKCVDETKLVQNILKDKVHPPNYNILTFNCQDWAARQLSNTTK